MRDQIRAITDRHLGLGRPSGDNMTYRCPFHKGGQERRPSFSVNMELGVFNCFTCHASGTIMKLLTMLGLSEREVKAETEGLEDGIKRNIAALRMRRAAEYRGPKSPFEADTILSETVLSVYSENCPMKLVNDGFDWRLLQQLKIGYDIQNDRIIYPIRDMFGNLAGVSGGAAFDWQVPKYNVYESGYKGDRGEWVPSPYGLWFDERYPDYKFHNRNFLWNYERVHPHLAQGKEVKTLIIVEGFKACLWLLQNGYWATVALMGSRMTEKQFEQLLKVQATVVLFLDNDEAGRDGTIKIGRRLQQAFGVYTAPYPTTERCQPDWLTPEQLHQAIGGAIPYPLYLQQGVSA